MTFKDAILKLEKAINEAGKTQNLEALSKSILNDIKARTNRGVGVEKLGSAPQKFKPLKASTIEKRIRDKRAGILATQTTPRKSNLTRTGKMTESLISREKTNEFSIQVDTNQSDKVIYNKNNGRNFLELSNINLKTITEYISSFIARTFEGK